MEFFNLIKASQKSKKPNGVFWYSAKTETRGKLQAQVILEDAGIETGRGQDYQLPVLTNFPVVDDLPEEGVIDFTWCDRYELQEDGRTWLPIAGNPQSNNIQDEHASLKADNAATTSGKDDGIQDRAFTHQQYSFEQRALGTWLYGLFDELSDDQKREISRLSMDMDATYPQNVLLACRNNDIRQLQHVFPETLADLFTDTKSIWPADGKSPQLGQLVSFFSEWINGHNSNTASIDGRKPGLDAVTAKWLKKSGNAVLQRTDTGTNAGGGNKTDRNPDYVHTLDTLDVEIALATLPMDFNIYDIPGAVYRRAKEIVTKKESPFKEWSAALRKCAGILDYSRAAIFALIRGAAENAHHFPVSLQTYINANLTESNHEAPTEETLAAAGHAPEVSWENEINERVVAERKATVEQPEIANMGDGVFSIEGLLGTPSNEVAKQEVENVEHVQMEETRNGQSETEAPEPAVESVDAVDTPATALTSADILAANAPHLADQAETDTNQNTDIPHQTGPETEQKQPEAQQIEPPVQQPEPSVPEFPAYFEPGRYEGLPNEVYHAANGVSSTQVKDARVSLMYFNARHVAKTIPRVPSKVLDMGNLVHALALQPENLEEEFSIEPVIPEGAFTTTATLRAFIDEYNNGLPVLLSADDIKRFIEEHNATLPAPASLGGDKDALGLAYLELPAEFKRIVGDDKNFTATAMKACIKEYNATLPAPVKTTGSRDALLEQLAIFNPDLVAQEAQKPAPLKVSGTKADMIQAVRSVKPDAVFADELLDAWRENPGDKILVTRQQLATALAIQSALLAHPTAGMLLTHPSRAVEVSYFGFDDETGLEVRVRPDLEIDLDGVRIGADLKTISMWNVKQESLRARLHREIIDRDYHLSAAMYCETAALDQFFWIFVNKDENYHWIAIIEASVELLELGMLEYRKTMRAIATGFDTGVWPAPITSDYTDELNDFDMRRLEALRAQA